MPEMNRSERRIYNLQLSTLKQKEWEKILSMDWGKEVVMPTPRTVMLNKRFRTTDARIGKDLLEISEHYYRDPETDTKELKDTLNHELTHAFLMDNQIPDRHYRGAWLTVARVLGFKGLMVVGDPHYVRLRFELWG